MSRLSAFVVLRCIEQQNILVQKREERCICVQAVVLLVNDTLNAGFVSEFKKRERVFFDSLTDCACSLRIEKLVDLCDVAVRVRGQRHNQVAHIATNSQLG